MLPPHTWWDANEEDHDSEALGSRGSNGVDRHDPGRRDHWLRSADCVAVNDPLGCSANVASAGPVAFNHKSPVGPSTNATSSAPVWHMDGWSEDDRGPI